jgi:hypothetical protein
MPRSVREWIIVLWPAFMAACRAGFWPCPALRIWPRITSSTSPGSTLARSRALLIAAAPSSWAGVLAKAPLNEPTAVRAALTTTISLAMFVISQIAEGHPDRQDGMS